MLNNWFSACIKLLWIILFRHKCTILSQHSAQFQAQLHKINFIETTFFIHFHSQHTSSLHRSHCQYVLLFWHYNTSGLNYLILHQLFIRIIITQKFCNPVLVTMVKSNRHAELPVRRSILRLSWSSYGLLGDSLLWSTVRPQENNLVNKNQQQENKECTYCFFFLSISTNKMKRLNLVPSAILFSEVWFSLYCERLYDPLYTSKEPAC